MLRIEKLSFAYGDLRVLWDVDLEVSEGEIVTVVGANGAGKSTILKNVSRLVKPLSGAVRFLDEDLGRCEPHDVVGRGVVQVPEGRKIFPELTVTENLRMGSYLPEARKDRERNLEWVFTLFPRLKERQHQRGGTLSGGEQQMLSIARALMARPKLLLLDEPSLGLAPLIVKQIFEAIRVLNREEGLTVFLVEQNAFAALKLSDRGYVLVNGKITMSGPSKELLSNPEIRAAYLEGGHH